jgi:hypothetical protein
MPEIAAFAVRNRTVQSLRLCCTEGVKMVRVIAPTTVACTTASVSPRSFLRERIRPVSRMSTAAWS